MSEKKHVLKDFFYQHYKRGQYTVNGSMNGNIDQAVSVFVGPNGIIHGDVYAKYARIEGTIEGSLTAYDYIVLSPSAKITGDIHCKEIMKIKCS